MTLLEIINVKKIYTLAPLCLVFILSACITTERGSITDKADTEKALEYSVQLARTYIRNRQWDSAKRHLKNALTIDDSSYEIYEALALVFQNTGEIELAEENYKKSIKLNNSFSRVRNNYATFLYQQRRFTEAVAQLEIVVSDQLYAQRTSAYINLGRAYMQIDQLNKAEQAFRRAYMMNRRNVGLQYQLAEVYFQLEDYPKAQQFYEAYRLQVKKQPAQALWLGIQLADKFEDKNTLSSYALVLKNLYPTSKEYINYKNKFSSNK